MYWLIAGLVIFFGVHIFSDFRSAREKTIQRLGEKRYKAGYSLLAVAFIPSNFRRFTAHPMLWSVTLWALLHLLANGNLTGLILFGAFGLYAVHAMSSQNARGVRPSQFRRPLFNDAAVVVAGLILYWVFLHFHAKLFGVPVIY